MVVVLCTFGAIYVVFGLFAWCLCRAASFTPEGRDED